MVVLEGLVVLPGRVVDPAEALVGLELAGAVPGFDDLAAAAFFGGRSDRQHRAGLIGQRFPRRDCRSEARSGNEIVPAGVAESGQRVVLKQQRDTRVVTRTGSTNKRRRHSGDAAVDGDAVLLQFSAQAVGRTVFLESGLRVGVQGACHVP